jgi:putative Holliday junction resolvase
MKYMGIDYGSKRVGVAISDDDGQMAFPKEVLPNNKFLMVELKNIIQSKKIEKVIVGESKNFDMSDNAIMNEVRFFSSELERDTGVPVLFEYEYLTSHQASRTNYEMGGSGAILDASAAAIILQSYLDKNKGK